MSKKSRKRNKKILAALALAGGAAMLGRGRGEISSNRPSGIDAASAAKNWITKKGSNVADTGSSFQSRFKTKIGNKWVGPNEARGYAPVTGVDHPILTQARRPPGGMRTFAAKKGGRVTGAAKRGFGRALMKGKK
tara:strand:- start:25 stop:429 length:405 start_codon:yes stop_codon:yes gene_type:complete